MCRLFYITIKYTLYYYYLSLDIYNTGADSPSPLAESPNICDILLKRQQFYKFFFYIVYLFIYLFRSKQIVSTFELTYICLSKNVELLETLRV